MHIGQLNTWYVAAGLGDGGGSYQDRLGRSGASCSRFHFGCSYASTASELIQDTDMLMHVHEIVSQGTAVEVNF